MFPLVLWVPDLASHPPGPAAERGQPAGSRRGWGLPGGFSSCGRPRGRDEVARGYLVRASSSWFCPGSALLQRSLL